jgi:hypothetical protein
MPRSSGGGGRDHRGAAPAHRQEIHLATDPLPRNLRTAHLLIGYITTAAFLTTTALEW